MFRTVSFVIVFLSLAYSQVRIEYPYYSDFRAMDYNGSTQLFFRINHSQSDSLWSFSNRNIFRWDVNTGQSGIFLSDYYQENFLTQSAQSISGYQFWHNDTSKYIYSGMVGAWCATPFILRYDDSSFYNASYNHCSRFDISKQNDSLIYTDTGLKSTDGGNNWLNAFVGNYGFLSLSPFDDSIIYANSPDYSVSKSTNGGVSFYITDTLKSAFTDRIFIYDNSPRYIYRKEISYGKFSLFRSDNFGEPYSWSLIFSSYSDFNISIDESQSGIIFLSYGKKIFKSADYGASFTLWRELDNKILGIYKKPLSDKLYALTKYRIFEITVNSLNTVTSLLNLTNETDWFPLNIGNKWVHASYEKTEFGTYEHKDNIVSKIVGDTIISGKTYQVMERFSSRLNIQLSPVYYRLDVPKITIFKMDESTGYSDEVVYLDLCAEAGDTVIRNFNGSINPYVISQISPVPLFGQQVSMQTHGFPSSLSEYERKYAKGFGLFSQAEGFCFGGTMMELKGCVISGKLFGDTSTVMGIDDFSNNIPFEFSLSQNYPNPFNPSTTISYQIPVQGLVSLKVYDILGREVADLVNETQPAGKYKVVFNGSKLSSGVYFYSLNAGSFTSVKKLVILK